MKNHQLHGRIGVNTTGISIPIHLHLQVYGKDMVNQRNIPNRIKMQGSSCRFAYPILLVLSFIGDVALGGTANGEHGTLN